MAAMIERQINDSINVKPLVERLANLVKAFKAVKAFSIQGVAQFSHFFSVLQMLSWNLKKFLLEHPL
jgi:hypothetical protein